MSDHTVTVPPDPTHEFIQAVEILALEGGEPDVDSMAIALQLMGSPKKFALAYLKLLEERDSYRQLATSHFQQYQTERAHLVAAGQQITRVIRERNRLFTAVSGDTDAKMALTIMTDTRLHMSSLDQLALLAHDQQQSQAAQAPLLTIPESAPPHENRS